MRIDNLDTLKKLANSYDWDELRQVFLDMVEEIRNVENIEDLKEMTGFNVSLGSLYLGKLIASKKVKDLVSVIDALKDREVPESQEDFE